MFWCVRNVVFTVTRWLIVLIGIDAQHREVACVARPHPVVGITTKFSNAFRRISYQANITEGLIHHHVIFIAIEKRLHLHFIYAIVGVRRDEFFGLSRECLFTLAFRHAIVYG